MPASTEIPAPQTIAIRLALRMVWMTAAKSSSLDCEDRRKGGEFGNSSLWSRGTYRVMFPVDREVVRAKEFCRCVLPIKDFGLRCLRHVLYSLLLLLRHIKLADFTNRKRKGHLNDTLKVEKLSPLDITRRYYFSGI